MFSISFILPIVIVVILWAFIFRRLTSKRSNKKKINSEVIDGFDEFELDYEINLDLRGQIKFSEYRYDQMMLILKTRTVLISTPLIILVLVFSVKNLSAFSIHDRSWYNLIIFAWIFLLPLSYLLQINRIYKQSSLLNSPNDFYISNHNIRIKNSDIDSTMNWSNFSHMKETRSLFLLYTNNFQATYLPKSMFTETELSDFRKLLEAKQINRVK